ncbi:MAG: diacylglycerol/lipid kinase family protein [Alphaproteobacteria bacterium]
MYSERKTQGTRRALIIYNPVAGRRRRTFFRKTVKHLRKAGLDITLLETTGPGDATDLARSASTAGGPARPDMIIAAGGDGTINEVANGLIGSDVPLGIIPMGTANVLARDIGLRQRSGLVAKTLARGFKRPIHLGRADTKRFVMMAGLGFDAQVVANINVNLKYKFGRLAYALAGMRELLFGPRKAFDVTIDGSTYRSAWVVIAKGRHFGGSFIVARNARLDDPALVACILPGTRRIDLARYLIAIGMGRIDKQPDVTFLRTQFIEIAENSDVSIEIDGDHATTALTSFSVGESLQLIQPA